MASQSNGSNGGIGFVGLLTIVFIVLKLLGIIKWSWFWVLSPSIFSVVVVLLILAFGIAVALLTD